MTISRAVARGWMWVDSSDDASGESTSMDRASDSCPSLWRRARRRFDAAGEVLVQMFMVTGGTMVVVALWAISRLLGRRADPPVRPE